MTYPPRQRYLHPARSLPSLPQPTSISQLYLLPNPLNPHLSYRPQPQNRSPPITQRPVCVSSIATPNHQRPATISTSSTPSDTDPPPSAAANAIPVTPPLPPSDPVNPACAVCHVFLASALERFNFPSTAPAALAAVESALHKSAFSHPYCEVSVVSNLFCRACWIRIYDLSICWSCGEVVRRGEERVGYGWCWWHWGCVGCLFCRVCFISYLENTILTIG